MKLRLLAASIGAALLISSCVDSPTADEGQILDLPTPSLAVVDGSNGAGGNPHFFWLNPLSDIDTWPGTADGTLDPVVEICLRNTAGDGCANAPTLASFTRDGSGSGRGSSDNITLDRQGHYGVKWRMSRTQPETGSVYRIRVLLEGQELGHADVIVLRQRDISAFNRQGGDLVAVSDQGNFNFGFRIEEGALEAIFCDADLDLDFANCEVGVEVAGDGAPTVVTIYGLDADGSPVAAVITVADGVFFDAAGNPLNNVVVAAELEFNPPSKELLLDDDQELPYFIEVNTFPGDVVIMPPGINVVICQKDDVLHARGIDDNLHPQMVLYKVSDPSATYPLGRTKRLATGVGSPECEGVAPAPAPAGALVGMLRSGATRVMELLGPEPVRARRLHGGLNTVVTRPSALGEEAFSTFGAVLGPNAAQTTAAVPDGFIDNTTSMLIQVRNALGEPFSFAGDDLDVIISSGPNAGAPVTVTDVGSGMYTATYVPTATGDDLVSIVLTTADGWNQGPIGGSPYTSHVNGPELDQENLLDGYLIPLPRGGIGRFNALTGAPDPTGASFDWHFGQTFVVGLTGQLSGINLPIQNPQGGTEDVTLTVTGTTTVANGLSAPDDGQVLATVTISPSAFAGVVLSDPSTWVAVDLTGFDLNVTAGQTLAFQLRTTSSIPYYCPPEESPNRPAGNFSARNFVLGPTWYQYGPTLGFQTFVIP